MKHRHEPFVEQNSGPGPDGARFLALRWRLRVNTEGSPSFIDLVVNKAVT